MKKYEINEGFHTRIAVARHENSLTQAELAELSGVSQRQIAAYEGHESKPRQNVLAKLANALDTTEEWLATGNGESGIKNIPGFSNKITKIPIIPLDKVIEWLVSMSPIYITDEFYPACYEVSNLAFAVKINDSAMIKQNENNVAFKEDSLIVFDPLIGIEDQDYVLVMSKSGECVFRQYFKGLKTSSLMPNDSRYPTEFIDNDDVDEKKILIVPAVAFESKLSAFKRLAEFFDII
uniref:helix-turn-helix domain-containing protein n=1 Tax=Photorhabdus sp. RM322S TaxID=3342825 RepID=UPI0036D82A4E